MRIHQVDLLEILPALKTWEGLSAGSRLAWVHADGNKTSQPGEFGVDEEAMLAAGLLDRTAKGLRRVGRGTRPLRVVLRAAERCTVLARNTDVALALRLYLQEGYTQIERGALLSVPSIYGWDATLELVERASSRSWVQDLLTSPPASWERRRLVGPRGGDVGWDRLLTPAVHSDLVRLVRQIVEGDGTILLGDLLDGSDGRGRRRRTRAVQAALRYLVLFPRLDPDDAHLKVGLLPTAVRALAGVEDPPPEVVDVELDAAPSFWIDDMLAVLLDSASGDARVKASGTELYQKTADRMHAALFGLPPSVEKWAQTDDVVRLNEALRGLQLLGLLSIEKEANGRRLLRPSPAGRAWLAASAEERLASLGRVVRGEDAWEEPDDWWVAHTASRMLAPHLGHHSNALADIHDAELAEALRAALASIPADGAVRLGAWLRRQVHAENPLTGTGPEGHRLRAAQEPGAWVAPEECERIWSSLLSSAVAFRLIPLGGVALAEGGEDPFIGLTSIGRFLIRRADAFDLPGAAAPGARIVVQPSFDVVFLGPAPEHEALLAPFAERVGHGVGTLFHLSRDAATRGAAMGLTGDEALERLRRMCADGLPENVERSVQDWFRRVRTVDAAHALVLTCPDEATASRIAAAGGKQATRLGPLAVSIASAQALGRIRKKLEREGILVGQPTGAAQRAKTRKPRRTYRRRW